VNFYKHHIGDYAAATAHLTFTEDAAYTRLLRIYYRDERPLPVEVRAVQRLAGARTPEEQEAVETVLREFFALTDDGWRNKRCDEEIGKAQAQAETNRQIAEAREARKRATMEQRNVERIVHESSDDSSASREPSHKPLATSQTPLANTDQKQKRSPRSASCPPRPDDVPEQVWLDWLAIRKAKRAPLTVTALETIQREATKAGVPLAVAVRTCVEQGWQGFRADWYANLTRHNGATHATNRQSAADRVRANAIAGELADRANGHPNLVGQDGRDLWSPVD
jgi:uncharacterized protein YdaU (DUF1376 family)